MRLATASLVLALTATTAAGQASAPATTTFGPFVAMNITTFGGSDAEGSQSRVAPGFGAQIQRSLGTAGFFLSGLHFAMRGAKADESGITGTMKLNYLEVPLIFGYSFPTSGKVRPYVMGGGHVAYLAGCSMHVDLGGGISGTVSCDNEDLDIDVTKTDVAVVGGGGLSFASGVNTISVDLRYALGLQSIASDADTKNRGFSLGVAYMIPLGRK